MCGSRRGSGRVPAFARQRGKPSAVLWLLQYTLRHAAPPDLSGPAPAARARRQRLAAAQRAAPLTDTLNESFASLPNDADALRRLQEEKARTGRTALPACSAVPALVPCST